MLDYSLKYNDLAFTDDLISLESTRKKLDVLKAIANLTRYMDIRYDSYFHDEFTHWLKRKEIKWTTKSTVNNYSLSNRIKLEDVLDSIKKLPYKHKIFSLFVLVSGLRTEEALRAFNNHTVLCNDGIMELFWDRGTKKSNAVYCHPLLHNKIDFKTSKAVYTFLNKRILGYEIRFLRKLNFTINSGKVDPLLAEFMQGRRGNISQKHYFLPSMYEHKNKWLEAWNLIIRDVGGDW
ncbi:integrase [Candidatus Nitrosotalea okcheonensis]|nr:integrase [Candidatus Nitrosotalea okcheonensis]